VTEVLHSPGQPLDTATLGFFEPRFGQDFSSVRVHTDEKAAESARSVNALAYTVGRDVVFGQGQYAPDSHAGRKLLAHELTHTLQPSATGTTASAKLEVTGVTDDAELEAEAVATAVVEGRSVSPTKLLGAQLAREVPPDAGKKTEAPPDAGAKNEAPSDAGAKDVDAADAGPTTPLATDAGAPAATCPPKEKLDAIEKQYREIVKKGRDKGANVAADNLEHFLAGSGTKRVLSVPWLRSFSSLIAAERVNQGRFEKSLNKEANKIKHGEKKTFNDHWDRQFTAGQSEELYYASGTSTIKSTGSFDLSCIENVVAIGGPVKHHWFDPYDWHAGLSAFIPGVGSVSDADALVMQNCRGAKPFEMEADWTQSLSATIKVGTLWNDESFSWTGP
jgi:hypothetical protein